MFVDRLAIHVGPSRALVMVPRRENAWNNSVAFAGLGDESVVRMNPDDATATSVAEGAWVAVSSAHGSLVATVAIDATLRRGVVSITHGHLGASPGLLTSGRIDVDSLTTMPRASGLAVAIRPLVG